MIPGLEAAKAYVALVGAIATALLGVYAADTTVGQVLTVVAVVATAFGTWAVSNSEAPPRPERGAVDVGTAVLIAVLVLLVLILVGLLPLR